MTATLERVTEGVPISLLNEAVRKWHAGRLKSNDYEVTIAIIFAFAPPDANGEPTGPAILLNGYPCDAVTRVVPYRWRVLGLEDAVIEIDAHYWDESEKGERLALLDHELTHIEPIFKDGMIALDAASRPRLVMRKHDHQFGWFDEVAERHGINSGEVKQAKRFAEKHGQTYLDFGQ